VTGQGKRNPEIKSDDRPRAKIDLTFLVDDKPDFYQVIAGGFSNQGLEEFC
jgi:hypothetical protein